jgi:protein-S-isoprenylcysteine O-methyltransferase Ste14
MNRITTKEKEGEHPFGDVGQLVLLGLFLVIWIGDSFFLRISTFPADYVPLFIRLALLAMAVLIAVYLAWSGHVVVNHKHRPNRMVSHGAFRYVRHPLYLASMLFYLGLAFSTLSLLSLAFFVIIFLFHNYVAAYEERFLVQEYGEDYERYKKRTGKWMPKIGRTRAKGDGV